MKSFHLPQLVLVCTCVVIELGVYPPKLACTPKLRSKGYMYPQFQNGVGMLISVYIVRSHARIQRGDRGSRPLSNTRSNPLKFSEQPSQHSPLGHHRHASETPLKGVSLAGR